MYQVFKVGMIITDDFQLLYAVYIQSEINNPTLLAWLHSAGSNLGIRWNERRCKWVEKKTCSHTECQVVSTRMTKNLMPFKKSVSSSSYVRT